MRRRPRPKHAVHRRGVIATLRRVVVPASALAARSAAPSRSRCAGPAARSRRRCCRSPRQARSVPRSAAPAAPAARAGGGARPARRACARRRCRAPAVAGAEVARHDVAPGWSGVADHPRRTSSEPPAGGVSRRWRKVSSCVRARGRARGGGEAVGRQSPTRRSAIRRQHVTGAQSTTVAAPGAVVTWRCGRRSPGRRRASPTHPRDVEPLPARAECRCATSSRLAVSAIAPPPTPSATTNSCAGWPGAVCASSLRACRRPTDRRTDASMRPNAVRSSRRARMPAERHGRGRCAPRPARAA